MSPIDQTCPKCLLFQLWIKITQSEIDTAAVILVAHRLVQYHLQPLCGLYCRVALFIFLLIYSMDRRRFKSIFIIAEKEISQVWSGLTTFFTDSNIYCRWCGCNIAYCKDYNVAAITITLYIMTLQLQKCHFIDNITKI